MDPLQALQAAYSVPADSKEQAELLANLRENLEIHSNYIPVLCSSLIRGVSGAQDSLLKRWTLDLLHYGISRANLPIEKRTELASQSLDVLAGILHDPNPATVKTAIQCFGTIYPLLFRFLCTNRTLRNMWDTLSACKSRILEMVWSPTATSGIKLAALKFMQRVILVQTRGVSDPRLQKPNDPNLSFCPGDHPFIPVVQLEAEGQKLMEGVITIFYTMPIPDMMAAVVNSWSSLAKQRPSQAHMIISALASWTPGAIYNFPASTVKSVEKAVRILLMHFSRTPQLSATYAHQINDALAQQAARMEQAVVNERNRKAAAAAEASRKRSINALNDEAGEAKRQKTDHPSTSISGVLANFDFTVLPHTLVTDLIVANLQVLTEQSLAAAVNTYKQANGLTPTPSTALRMPSVSAETQIKSVPPPVEKSAVKMEPVDPLQMDIDDEEIDYEPDELNDELSRNQGLPPDLPEGVELIDVDEALRFADFKLPPPREVSESERRALVRSSMSRIWDTSSDLTPTGEAMSTSHQLVQSAPSQDLWMLLLVRMITRLTPPTEDGDVQNEEDKTNSMEVDTISRQERIRQTLFDYIMTDFPARERLAIIWMNEEWYNDKLRSARNPDWHQNYPIWVQKIVTVYEPLIDAKDRTFARFLLDIPLVPEDVLFMLRDLCVEPDRMQVGFTTLREFVTQRVPLRYQAMKILLDLTTHQEKVTRGAAIITVKRWVPDVQPMGDMVRNFALRLLRRLQKRPIDEAQTDGQANGGGDSDDAMEDGEMPQEEVVQTEFLPEQVELPAQRAQILQHVELIFALCVKHPEFLDEIFDAYSQMDVTVQGAIQDLITALVRSLGPSHGKLQSLMRNFPAGAESLALRILTIFTENGRPSPPLVTLVKQLMSERELDARFLIPIIAEMDKADIVRHLPRIVSMLNNTPETKQLVKSVFESIVTTPPQTFGSVTSNLPRVRQSELLTPAELMVLLHESEKEIGLKSAIEAIGICFSMTDVFRSEILAVVMQQIVDEPVLPVLFLRTVIQAVTTYKSLVGFVSTTLLSRLITKKIWTNPPLWEGFIRCAKTIAPASFGALLQLPKDPLRELVDKQPGLKAGLREFVLKKAGNKARQAGFLDLFGDDRSQTESPAPQPQPQPLPQTQPLPTPAPTA
ncbi:Symplekin tight junction protein C terminal-domain-containing protein [Phellopilus nigrolimitatus]|nr:Symplekin tight junction protein C terminal-domain-containing protein [Phellopilus nigrolimitatus]